MRHFRRRRFAHSGAKQEKVWERFGISFLANAVGAAVEVPISTPVVLESAAVDSNWMIRQVRLSLTYTYHMAINVANCEPILYLGVYMKDIANLAVASPFTPLGEDWLDIWSVQFVSSVSTALTRPVNLTADAASRTIRSMRKMDQGQGLFLSLTLINFTAATDTTPLCGGRATVSNLWSRSRPK